MKQCKNCGSFAINPSFHGRGKGVDLDLCDVCYWRRRADRHALQAVGTHPAHCARHCEAVAFQNEVRTLQSELERTKSDYQKACRLVADMHAAAVGEMTGPVLGVVEDVAALKAERDALRKDAERLDYLDKNLHWKMGWRVQKAPSGTLSVGPIIQLNGPTTGIREAIDAAIANDEGKTE